jgi:hypothetical protein
VPPCPRSERPARAWPRPAPALLALVWSLAACGGARAYPANPGPYDRIPEAWSADLRQARLAFLRGDTAAALQRLERLRDERPKALPVRIFLQEVELARLEADASPGGPEEALARLARDYERRAAEQPAPENLVLAARLCTDEARALELLERAEALDPDCVWVHYGRAWWAAVQKRYREAREEVRAVQRLDAGHLPTLRLSAAMLAGAGEVEEAAGALDAWLERTADDPLYSPFERADALLDLAALEVLNDRPKRALELLAELDPRALREPARAEEVRAVALDARGEYAESLAAVHRASRLDPLAVLPLVQEAMLLASAGDLAGEKAAWEELLARTEMASADPRDPAAIDIESMLFRLQAHARIERIERETGAP